jgi:hypothetical protein
LAGSPSFSPPPLSVVHTARIVEADGKTSKKDLKNPDKSLRSKDVIGIVSLTGLKWTGHEYTGASRRPAERQDV